MAELQTKTETSNASRFEERLKNRFSIEGNALLGKNLEHSNFFEKINSYSENFSVIKIKFERATLREASSFKKFMERVIAEDGRNLIIDLNDCEFVDSSFFGVLVAGVKRLKALDKKFFLAYNSQNRLPIFSATGLDKVFTVYETVEEAIKH
ncbi:MAG: STAS domain-containing protein [Ignavibacteriae bacterium]|nr:STAS domain-containing protein [Ignavibacteriota bacterium]MCB9206790.1 STAS domain-containing protein [Ignavibacteriales bacterium]MCB9210202.1 STAS domain-containing protein [Ignavibacteriales bacterium]MCB9218413.1 STAS domain-containing protein [Ignavibacteriales bacterium]MCB9259581.1 STAS domain-containing protein [Ignavibacteriales bacterium]